MEQTQKTKRKRERDAETVELPDAPTEVSEQSAEVSEDAACCLADIEDVLKDCEPKLTDEEILAAGHPNSNDDKYDGPAGRRWDWKVEEYEADEARFHEAYERVNGVEYEHGGCGCSH